MNWGLFGKVPRLDLTKSAFYGHNKRAATVPFDVLYDFTMSANNVQATGTSGLIANVASSSEQGGWPTWAAFDGLEPSGSINGWFSFDTIPEWIQVQFNESQLVRRVDMVAMTYGGYNAWAPKVFTIQGSNDGTNFDILKSVSTTNWTGNETRSFTFPTNSTKYKYIRVNVTGTEIGAGQGAAILEMRLYT
jgi:hypothetical protein